MVYSVQSEWKDFFNETITAAQFDEWNNAAMVAINTYVTGYPATNVPSAHTATAKLISDEMIMTTCNFVKESSMTNPPEFIHYKLSHFTPKHYELMNIIKSIKKVGKIVF